MLEIYRAFEQLAPCDCGRSQRAVTVENDRIIISCRGCGRQVITDEVRAVEDWEEELRYNPYHDRGTGGSAPAEGAAAVCLSFPRGRRERGFMLEQVQAIMSRNFSHANMVLSERQERE